MQQLMETMTTISERPLSGEEGTARTRWDALKDALRRARNDVLACRSRRVVLMLVLLWILSGFDLVFTLLAQQIGDFREANPVARELLASPALLVAFKVSTLMYASAILLVLRRHWLTELGCWCLSVVYTGLSFAWFVYYTTPWQR